MDSFSPLGDHLSLELLSFSTSPAPLYPEDTASEYSLFPSLAYDDMASPGSTWFYPCDLSSSLNDNEYNSMYPFDNGQVSDWLSDPDPDLPIFDPSSVAVASPLLRLQSHESTDLHRQALDPQLYPESLSSSSSLSSVSGFDNSPRFQQNMSLSAAEVERLTEIAMGRLPPPACSSPTVKRLQNLAKIETGPHLQPKVEATISPKPTKSNRRRTGGRDATDSLALKPKSSKPTHNQIEKKYRANLNSKISELRDCIPELRAQSSSDSDEAENPEGCHISKARILTAAIKFINALEKELDAQNRRGGKRWV